MDAYTGPGAGERGLDTAGISDLVKFEGLPKC